MRKGGARASDEAAVIRILNDVRKDNGLATFQENPGLSELARVLCKTKFVNRQRIDLDALVEAACHVRGEKPKQYAKDGYGSYKDAPAKDAAWKEWHGHEKDVTQAFDKSAIAALASIGKLDVPYDRHVVLFQADEIGIAATRPELVVGALALSPESLRKGDSSRAPHSQILHKKYTQIGVGVVRQRFEDAYGDEHDRAFYAVIITPELPK